MKKILVIRFSSIGDIVLTTPVIRCLKQQVPGIELHFLTKEQYRTILQPNPYIDRLHVLKGGLGEVLPALKAEKFDHIVDLHRNLRSFRVLLALRRPFTTFPKLNFRKWLLTRFKIDLLPRIHIVDRYFRAVRSLGAGNDGEGLNYFIPEEALAAQELLPETHRNGYLAFSIGGKHGTKKLPVAKMIAVCREVRKPVVLLGGAEDGENGRKTAEGAGALVYNACGLLSLGQSAAVILQAELVITHDTGLMHIAAALRKKIVSVWGNTVPAFGMYPYFPEDLKENSFIEEVKGLPCRPCSKLGYARCPKGHFRCMERIDAASIGVIAKNILEVEIKEKTY